MGKSALITQLTTGQFYDSALGGGRQSVFNKTHEMVVPKALRQGKIDVPNQITFKIWDQTPSTNTYVAKNFYNGTSVALIVFSLTSLESFQEIDRYYDSVMAQCESSTIKILVANKSDLKAQH